MTTFPRRNQIDKLSPTELKIHEAIQAVEDLPADPRLTEAVILLGQAKDKLSDFIDDVTT